MKKKFNKIGFIYDVIFTLLIPLLILTKLSDPAYLGQQYSFFLAIAFPIGYRIYDFNQKKKGIF